MVGITQERLFAMSKNELIKLAQEYKIKNYGRLNKEELVKQLLAKQPPVSETPLNQETAPPSEPSSYRKQEQIEETKYYLGPNISGGETRESLPASYGETKLVLLVRDPDCIFAYWEIAEQRLNLARQELRDQWEKCKTVLRVYDTTGLEFEQIDASKCFDLETNGADNYYIHVNRPNHSFITEWGLLTPEGRFYSIARSNQVTTPSNAISEITDEEWWSSREELYALGGALQPFGSSGVNW